MSLKEKTWIIPPPCLPLVEEKSDDGMFIVCSVCKTFDEEGINFAKVKMRSCFWSYQFVEHVCLARHKDNCLKKAMREEASKKGLTVQRKSLKQSILPYASSNPSRLEIRERIVGRVAPSLAFGNTVAREEVLRHVESVQLTNNSVYCNSLIAKKDLSDVTVQGGIKACMKYLPAANVEKSGYRIGQIEGTESLFSLFSEHCTGKENVR